MFFLQLVRWRRREVGATRSPCREHSERSQRSRSTGSKFVRKVRRRMRYHCRTHTLTF